MNISSDDSVIEQTPEKKKRRKIMQKPKQDVESSMEINKEESYLLKQLVEVFTNNISQEATFSNFNSEEKNTQPLSTVVSNDDDYSKTDTKPRGTCSFYGLTDPIQQTFSRNSHNLYVFYLIEEILKFTPNNFPKNSHMQLVGQINYYEETKSFMLSSLEPAEYFKTSTIKVNLTQLTVRPNDGEKIIVFCLFTFEGDMPMIVINFFRKLTVIYSNYVNLMLTLRTTVPLENFEKILLEDYSLANNESIVLDEDKFLSDLLLSFSEEANNENELSDLTLDALLNDLSFEKL